MITADEMCTLGFKIALVSVSLISLPACTSTPLSNGSLASKTAEVLTMSENNFKITNEVSNGTTVSYTAEAENGAKYVCTIEKNGSSASSPTCIEHKLLQSIDLHQANR